MRPGFVASVLVAFFGTMAVIPETVWWGTTLSVGVGSAFVGGIVYTLARRRYHT